MVGLIKKEKDLIVKENWIYNKKTLNNKF